jgi:glycosyltransferase involved in cell wall biosynthesis
MKNLDPFLSKAFEVNYITSPAYFNNLKFIPNRLMFFLFLLYKIKTFKRYNIILSHVPEGSFIISFTKTPLIHIFHGNHNPMTSSRFWYGKYFKSIFNFFEKRILKEAKLNYTVGNERPNVLKILNPIYHSICIKSIETRSGFIFAGRLEKIKNIDKIIKIYSLLDKEIVNDNLLFIAGTGSQEFFLKQMVTKMNLSNNIIFTGEISNNELIEIVSGKRILLMASSQEGLPMAIAESLSVGVPVISTNTGDISRVIKNDFNGFLLPIEFDLKSYVDKIKNILSNYEFFASNASKSSEIFKAENVANKLINDIKNVIKQN